MKNLISRRLLFLIGLTCAMIAVAFVVEYALSRASERQFGHTQAGHVLGWIGLAMILVVFAYPAERWFHPNRVWSKPGLYIHEGFGILGALLILVHSGAHFHAVVPVMALSALGLVVVSGIVGEFLHTLAFRSLYEQRHELAREGLTEEAIEARLKELASQEGVLRWWPWVHVPLTAVFVVLAIAHIMGALYFGGL
jgi:hypothetical protein